MKQRRQNEIRGAQSYYSADVTQNPNSRTDVPKKLKSSATTIRGTDVTIGYLRGSVSKIPEKLGDFFRIASKLNVSFED
jgi:hypothetical protein